MIDEYNGSQAVEFINDVIVINPITLYSFFKVDSIEELFNKVIDYVNQNKEVFDKLNLPKTYMYNYQVSNKNYVDVNKLSFLDDINLTIAILAKTKGNMYIPNRSIHIEKSMFNQILIYDRKDIYGK